MREKIKDADLAAILFFRRKKKERKKERKNAIVKKKVKVDRPRDLTSLRLSKLILPTLEPEQRANA